MSRAMSRGSGMGSYCYTAGDDTWQWSDGVFTIHGFHRGEVVPTTALLLSHAYTADRRHPASPGRDHHQPADRARHSRGPGSQASRR
jgi:hypothetical protein